MSNWTGNPRKSEQMMNKTIHYEIVDQVGVFTIDNGKQNVMSTAMYEPFYRDLRAFLDNDEVKVAILRGSEGRSFCAGDDIKSLERTADMDPDYPMMIQDINRTKPIIGAVKGWCLGQGLLHLLTLTDIRIATEDAKFGFPEIQFGMGGAGGATRLGQQIPHTLAMYLLMTGDYYSAQQAREAFMINEVVADDSLFDRAMEIAQRIARHPLTGITMEMELYALGMDMQRRERNSLMRSTYKGHRVAFEKATGGRKPIEFKPLEQAK
jgi:enoyl-CoA hydratase/carnithine racemase